MEQEKLTYLHYIRKSLVEKQATNPRYSLRMYARFLNVDPGDLSRILSGKSIPSFNLGERIVKMLKLSPEDARHFLITLMEDRNRVILERIDAVANSLGLQVEKTTL